MLVFANMLNEWSQKGKPPTNFKIKATESSFKPVPKNQGPWVLNGFAMNKTVTVNSS